MYRTVFASLACLSAFSALSSAINLEAHSELESFDMLLEATDEASYSLGEVDSSGNNKGKKPGKVHLSEFLADGGPAAPVPDVHINTHNKALDGTIRPEALTWPGGGSKPLPFKGANGLEEQIKATPKNTTIKVDVGTSSGSSGNPGYRTTLPNTYLPALKDAGWITGWDAPNPAATKAAERRTFTIYRGSRLI